MQSGGREESLKLKARMGLGTWGNLALRYFDSCKTWLQISTWTSGHYCTMGKVNCQRVRVLHHRPEDWKEEPRPSCTLLQQACNSIPGLRSRREAVERSGVLPRSRQTPSSTQHRQAFVRRRSPECDQTSTIRGDQLGANLSPAGSIGNVRFDSRGPLAPTSGPPPHQRSTW